MKDWGRETSRLAAFYLLKELLGEFWLFGPPSPPPAVVLSSPQCGGLATARRSACFSDAFSAGLNDAKIVLWLQRLASWSASSSPTE